MNGLHFYLRASRYLSLCTLSTSVFLYFISEHWETYIGKGNIDISYITFMQVSNLCTHVILLFLYMVSCNMCLHCYINNVHHSIVM